jgi:hypothetical protein
MELTHFNLKTSDSFQEEFTVFNTEPLVSLDTDLFGKHFVKFNFDNKSWEYFRDNILSTIVDKYNESIVLKVERAIKRRVKGTSKGIQIVYRDNEDLIWHVFIKFIETIEVSSDR